MSKDPPARSQRFRIETARPRQRLDAWLAGRIPTLSRSAIHRLIDHGHITVNAQTVKPSYAPRTGDTVIVSLPPPGPPSTQPQALPLDVLFEDEDVLVLNKAAGRVVHPAPGHADGTVVNALLHHCGESLSGIGGVSRPGIVHRLDQDTSGCLIVAKNDVSHRALAEQFANRTVAKIYLAILCGHISPARGTMDGNLARHPTHRKRMTVAEGTGREARTSYHLVEPLYQTDLVEAELHTGRTHQIRVHFKQRGCPLFGDSTYGDRQTKKVASLTGFVPARQLLHAWKLSFLHPRTGEVIRIVAPMPKDFEEALKRLKTCRKR